MPERAREFEYTKKADSSGINATSSKLRGGIEDNKQLLKLSLLHVGGREKRMFFGWGIKKKENSPSWIRGSARKGEGVRIYKSSDSFGINATSSKLRGGVEDITLLYINKVGASHDAPTRNP